MSNKATAHEALIYVMVTMAAVDRAMSDPEMRKIGNIVQTLPVFRDFDPEKLVLISEDCGKMLGEDGGLEKVLDIIENSIPTKLQDTAYALGVEVAAADLIVEQEELRFLQMLRDRLNLDKLTIAAIERGARARHAVL